MVQIRKRNRFILLCLLLCLLTTVATGAEMFKGEVDWETGQIVVMGFGAPPEGASKAQGKLMAQRAAKADAYRNALEVIEGIRVSSETFVKDYVAESDIIYTQVQGFIQGGVFTDIEYDFDGICQVTLVLPLGGQKSLTNVVKDSAVKKLPKEVVIVPVQPEKPVNYVEPIVSKPVHEYTGIIFDARGYSVKPAIYPQIFDSNGYLLYGPTTVDVNKSGFTTMVAYARDINKAKIMERVGNNPLIVSVTSVIKSSKGTVTDIVLDTKTAEVFQKLKESNSQIANGAVVFVID